MSRPDRIEIERKFLVQSDAWKRGATGTRFRQGYLSTDRDRTVRIRLEGAGARLNIKGKKTGARSIELEYPIPADDASFLIDNLCKPHVIDKTRYRIDHAGMTWEVDEFHGINDGLVVAEIELNDEDQPFERPSWLGAEVTEDGRYSNAALSDTPYSQWG